MKRDINFVKSFCNNENLNIAILIKNQILSRAKFTKINSKMYKT